MAKFYLGLSNNQLQTILKDRGIPGRSKLTKKYDMITALIADDRKKQTKTDKPFKVQGTQLSSQNKESKTSFYDFKFPMKNLTNEFPRSSAVIEVNLDRLHDLDRQTLSMLAELFYYHGEKAKSWWELASAIKERIFGSEISSSAKFSQPFRFIWNSSSLSHEGVNRGGGPYIEAEFLDNLRHGVMKTYTPENDISIRVTNYLNDLRDGWEETYDIMGSLLGKLHWSKGKLDGLSEVYESDGRGRTVVPYLNGKAHGLSETYVNGKLVNWRMFNNGEVLGIEWGTDGILNGDIVTFTDSKGQKVSKPFDDFNKSDLVPVGYFLPGVGEVTQATYLDYLSLLREETGLIPNMIRIVTDY